MEKPTYDYASLDRLLSEGIYPDEIVKSFRKMFVVLIEYLAKNPEEAEAVIRVARHLEAICEVLEDLKEVKKTV